MNKIICVLFVLSFGSFFGQTNVFTVKSGSYSDPSVWNINSIPDSLANILVSAGDTLTVDSSRSAINFSICGNAVLKADSGVIIGVYGNWSNSGTFLPGSSTVRFGGCTLQTVGGNSVTTFFNLECSNGAGVCTSKDVKVSNLLTVSHGTLNLNTFKLILLSDSDRTAAIAPLLNGADVAGKITMQRYLSGTTTGWRFLGSPVSTKLTDWKADFLTSGFPGSAYPNYYFCSIYKYDETVGGTSEYGYVAPAHANDSLKPGKGYWCWVGPTPDLVDVTGIPKKGNHSFDVSLTPDAGKAHDGWNLVANPYPSAIDWDSEYWTKVGIQNAIYIWDPETEQYTTYINGVGINGGSNIIASSQSFWVQANQNNPVLSSTEEVKSQEQINVNKKMPLSALKLSINGNGGNDETVVAFRANALEEIEADKDAIKLFTDNPLVPSLSTVVDSSDLAINFMSVVHSADIPVRVKVGASGTYTLSGKGFAFPNDRCLYLEDLVTGSLINIRNDFSYSFLISDTTKAPRFVIHITNPVKYTSKSPTCSYNTNGKIKLINTTGACTFDWMDELGNTIATHTSVNGFDSLLNLSSGFYTVKISNALAHCPMLRQEIRIEKIEALSVNAMVSGNYCRNTKNGNIQLNNISGGTAPYTASWMDTPEQGSRYNLPVGIYTLILSDANNCRDTGFYSISSESQLMAQFSVANDTAEIFQHTKVKFNNQSVAFSEVKWTAGLAVSSENNPDFVFTTAGTHTIILTVKDQHCTSEKTMHINVKPLHLQYGMEEAPDIFLSENDAVIQFKNQESKIYNVSVFSADGKNIFEKRIETQNEVQTFPLGESHGIYLVKCESNGLVTTNKLIK